MTKAKAKQPAPATGPLFCPKCGRPPEEYQQCGGYPVLPCPDLVPADPATTVTLYCSTHDVTRTALAVDVMRGKVDLSHLCTQNCTVTVVPAEGVTREEAPSLSLGEAPPLVPASDAIIRDASLSETQAEAGPLPGAVQEAIMQDAVAREQVAAADDSSTQGATPEAQQ